MYMKKSSFLLLWMPVMFVMLACEGTEAKIEEFLPNDSVKVEGTKFVAGHEEALESVLRSIPSEYINKARTTLHIAYQHTSHGTHVARGMFGLPGYKSGDNELFAITDKNRAVGKLDFNDNVLSRYAPPGVTATDLSENETAFIQTTRNYLDASINAHINVVMWSWCDIAGHKPLENYIPGMETLIKEYGPNGTKIGTGNGQRKEPVHFIFMTGHANANNNVGTGKPKNQADLINDYCNKEKLFCLDYYSIDSHDMDGNYWDDAGDDGNSREYGGNFYKEWQDKHSVGNGFYYNLESPNGKVAFGDHNTQHITANRKAYAMWWILARIAGWDGE